MKDLFITVTHHENFTKSVVQVWDPALARRIEIDDAYQRPALDHITVPFRDLHKEIQAMADKHQARMLLVQDTGIYIAATP